MEFNFYLNWCVFLGVEPKTIMTLEQMRRTTHEEEQSFDAKKVSDIWKQIFKPIANTVCVEIRNSYSQVKNIVFYT